MQKFKLLKDFESPFGTVHSGVVKTIKEWADFFHMEEKDILLKKDWFLLIDESQYLDLDYVQPKELQKNYPKLLYTIMADFPQLTPNDYSRIASYVLCTCHWCHNENLKCVCGRDE